MRPISKLLCALMMAVMLIGIVPDAFAQEYDEDQCSSAPIFEINARPDGEPGLVTETVNYIRGVVVAAVYNLFVGISSSPTFEYAAMAAATLSVAIFGAAFMFGIVPLTLGQALIRSFKLALVFIAISPDAWYFFSSTVFRFFDAGTDELILLFVNTSMGVPMPVTIPIFGDWLYFEFGVTNPFWLFDNLVESVFSPKAVMTFIAMMTTGPMGFAMGLMFGAGTVIFLFQTFAAMKVYCVSIIAKGLLFGIAPIMFVFLLFDKTKQIFMGWVNQLVNFSLQPILMFAFLSFFIILMESAYYNMLDGIEVCYEEVTMVDGNIDMTKMWRIRTPDNPTPTAWSWEGALQCLADPNEGDCPAFPISIVDLLTFLLTAYIGFKMVSVVPSIAIEISGSSLLLNQVGEGTRWGGSGGSGGGSMMGRLFGGGGS